MATIDQIAQNVRDRVLQNQNHQPQDIESAINATFDDLALSGLVHQDETAVRADLDSKLFGFGVLQPFLADESIEEIWINRPDEIFYARHGVVERVSLQLPAEILRTLVLRMLRDTGRRIDSSLPFADAILADGSRLHVVIPDVTAASWSVNIRKFPAKILGLAALVANGSVTEIQADYLREATLAGKNILISGATHSGKTTLLTALLAELPAQTRLISCEETFELRSSLEDWVPMQARQPNLEGRGEIPLRRLVKEALRMRPDRLVIGEVREAEALDLLIAMNSGVAGACTIHANSAASAVTKLCTLPLLAGPNISADFVNATVLSAVDLVVHCEYRGALGRRIAHIGQVMTGADGRPTAEQVQL